MGRLSFQISTLNTLTVCVVRGTKTEVMMVVNTLLRNGDEIVLTVCSSIKLRVEMFVCLRNSYVTKGRNSLLVEDGLTMFSQDNQDVTKSEKKRMIQTQKNFQIKKMTQMQDSQKNPEDFKPVIPKWPTPTGKKEDDVKKHCEAKIKVSATYKSCRRVLGVRFSIKGAVEQCVADTLLTDSFEMSVPAALATMKTICLDVANDDEEKKINGETCPNDCNGNGKCIKGVCKCNAGFKAFDCSTKVVDKSPCTPWRQRFPVEAGARNHAICSSNGDPHPVTFDGQRFDYYKIGDWAMVQSDRRDFHVHARTHKCWRVSCNCAVVVKEGQDVISVNYCGDRNNPFIGFLSKKEPLHGTGIERSGNTYRIVMASGARVELRINMNHQALWMDMKIIVPNFDFKHIDGLCGSWDKNRGNDGGKHTVEKWRRNRANSLFFYKAKGGDVCLPKKLLCNKGKKFVARGGWTNYVFPGQTKCNKKREEKNDPNSEELPDKTNDPDAGLPKDPEKFKPVIPKWPTPTGKKEKDVKKHCEAKIKVSATYKSCRRVLGVRFSIKGAVEQCVADTLLTDSFEMSIPAALATMKTICLDVANDDEEKKIYGETCPNDCNGNGKCVKGVCECNRVSKPSIV